MTDVEQKTTTSGHYTRREQTLGAMFEREVDCRRVGFEVADESP